MSKIPSEALASAGRRERNMRQKRSRILTAAAALFEERGFDGATTQEISDRADIATGTLFRYAPSKGQLLLMVYNEEFRRAAAQGRRKAASVPDVLGQINALIEPIVTAGSRNATNMAVYQRELLFGVSEEIHRAEGLSLVADLEDEIKRILIKAAGPLDERKSQQLAASRAARSVFAVLHLALVQSATGAHLGSNIEADLGAQIAQIVQGFSTLTATPAAGSLAMGATAPADEWRN